MYVAQCQTFRAEIFRTELNQLVLVSSSIYFRFQNVNKNGGVDLVSLRNILSTVLVENIQNRMVNFIFVLYLCCLKWAAIQ